MDAPTEGGVRTPAESLAEGHRLLAAGRPFHAHEVFEDAWKSAPGDEREFWRGLAQLAVGVTHAARGNATGAARLLERGAANVAPYAGDRPHGVDIDAVLTWCRRAVAAIDSGERVLTPPPLPH